MKVSPIFSSFPSIFEGNIWFFSCLMFHCTYCVKLLLNNELKPSGNLCIKPAFFLLSSRGRLHWLQKEVHGMEVYEKRTPLLSWFITLVNWFQIILNAWISSFKSSSTLLLNDVHFVDFGPWYLLTLNFRRDPTLLFVNKKETKDSSLWICLLLFFYKLRAIQCLSLSHI